MTDVTFLKLLKYPFGIKEIAVYNFLRKQRQSCHFSVKTKNGLPLTEYVFY